MGLDVYSYTIVGIPVRESDLFVPEQALIHSKCCKDDLARHKKFCSDCGKRLVSKRGKQATPELIKLIQHVKFDIIDFSDLCLDDMKMYIHNCCSEQTCEDIDFPMVLGIKIRSFHSSCNVLPISFSELQETKDEVLKMADIMGLRYVDADVQIYPCLYFSY
jgi:hypothetical protein